jgi:predicted small integral membrane protein
MSLEWMAWTGPTAIFASAVVVMLVVMGVLSVRHRSIARKGFLPIETELGDRLYIGLLTIGLGMAAWMAFTEASLAIASAIAVVWLAVVMRWG